MTTITTGLSGIALYLPPYRVDLQRWCEWTGADWDKIRQVVGSGFRLLGPRQSIYTMAANAVLRLIQQNDVDPGKVRYLGLGTESSTDNSAGAIIVKGMVNAALKGLGGDWTYANLYAFLKSPKKFAKGTKMTFAGIRKAGERAALIAYLRSLSPAPKPLP